MPDFAALLPADLSALPRYLVALAIGLLMGLERERNPAARAGLRTFALTGLFAALIAHLAEITKTPALIAVGLAVTGLFVIASYFRTAGDDADPGTTTVAALLLCYALGVLVWAGQTQLAVMLGVTATVLLYFKPELRGLSARLSRRDLLSVLQFAVLSLIVLPLLPNRDMGPYNALNPYQIWWMVVLIAGLGLAAYAALRLVGPQRGAVVLGLLGGLVSSTATTLAFSRHARADAAMVPVAVVVIVLANLVVLVRLAGLVAVVAPGALAAVLPVFAGGVLLGGAGAIYGIRTLKPAGRAPELPVSNPTELRGALGFGLLYSLVLLAAAVLGDWLGNQGLYVVALVSGLTDVDAITLTSLRLFNRELLDPANVANLIVLAVLANLVFKSALAWGIGGRAVAAHAIAGMATLGAGLVIAWGVVRLLG
jgi:uncharacterized membrane protein (DUF4010 family)